MEAHPSSPEPPGPPRFEFSTAGRIVFGAGTLAYVRDVAPSLGRRPLVVTGATPERARPLLDLLAGCGLDAAQFSVPGEPDVEVVRRGVAAARDNRCDHVLGFGGGAAIDTAKAVAIVATNPGDVMDYLEIIGQGRSLVRASLPCIAIPTTAGTGSEVTRNSVIASREHRVKVSLRSPLMLPRLAIVDPELTYRLPRAVTAATGLDALTQLIEPFVCTRANALTDGLCQEGMIRVARSLRTAFAGAPEGKATAAIADVAGGPAEGNGQARARAGAPGSASATRFASGPATAREDMAVASLFGGLALANAGLGAVHGIAGPLGGMIEAPHGAVCAALLPNAVAVNLRALRERVPLSPALTRYRRMAELLTGDLGASADAGVAWLRLLVADLGILGLASYGVDSALIEQLVENAARASSMKANPVQLHREELAEIVEGAL